MNLLIRRFPFIVLSLLAVAMLTFMVACGDDDDDDGGATTPAATTGGATGGATDEPSATELEPINVKAVLAIEASSFLPVYAARYNNFYEEEGIDLDFTVGGTGGKESQALLAGDADIVFSSGVELLKLAAQDRDVVAVGGIEVGGVDVLIMRKGLADELGVTEDSPLDEKLAAENWDGRRVGFTSPGALSNGLVLYWATSAGVEVGDVEQLALGPGVQQVAAMQQGEVDYISSFHPFSDQMVENGSAIELVDLTEGEDPSLEGFLEQIVMTTRDYADSNPEAVRRFVKATVRGAQWINENSAEDVVAMWQSFEAFAQQDPASLLDQVQQFQDGGIFPDDGAMEVSGLEVVHEVLLAGGILTEPVENVADLIDTSYLPE